jgi:hypothetical protein
MIQNGVRTLDGETPHVGFISQKGDTSGTRAYFRDAFRRPSTNVEFNKRTGESTRLGLHSLHYRTVESQIARSVNLLGAIEHSNRLLTEFAVKPPSDMGWPSDKAASAAAANATRTTGRAFVSRYVGPSTVDQLSAIHDHVQASDMENLPPGAQLPGEARWFVVPKQVSQSFDAQTKALASSTWSIYNQAAVNSFRNAVLPLSPRWLLGNIAELFARGAIGKAMPLGPSWWIARSGLNRLRLSDPGAYEDLMNRSVAGGLITSQIRNSLFTGHERLEGHAGYLAAKVFGAALRVTPGVAQLRFLYNHYAKWIKVVTPLFEKEFQKAAVGREIMNELRDFHGEWYKALAHWGPAIDDVMQGLTHTANQRHYGRQVDIIVGRYNKLSPGTRQIVQGYAPFITWYVNAARFVYKTMPLEHPVIEGTLAASYVADEKKRNSEGMGYFGPNPIKPFLQGTVPVGDGAHTPLQHYLPWGAFSDVGSIAGTINPIWGPAFNTGSGTDWKGGPVSHPKGMNDIEARAMATVNSMFEAMVPMAAAAHRVLQRGGSAYDTSNLLDVQLRPGTKRDIGAGFVKTFNPLRSYKASSRVPGAGSSAPVRLKLGGGSGSAHGIKLGGTGSASGIKLGGG